MSTQADHALHEEILYSLAQLYKQNFEFKIAYNLMGEAIRLSAAVYGR
jgi:hypothetical protein